MKDILAAPQRPQLARLAAQRSLVAFDFDGTLAPIVDDPGTAWPRVGTRALLVDVALRYPCAVVSGRALADLRQRLEGVPILHYVGNHGAEEGWDDDGARALVRPIVVGWRDAIAPAVAGRPGIWLEDKGLSLSVHYRAAPDPAAAAGFLEGLAAALPAARVIPGHLVVNIVPMASRDKGGALRRLCDRVGAEAVLYVGDDVTDEHAFSRSDLPGLIAVRVGDGPSSAPYCLRDQVEIDGLLAALAALRPPP